MTPDDDDAWPIDHLMMTYVTTRTMADGKRVWALRDCDGTVVFESTSSSGPYFYAAERDARVVQRH